MENRVIKFRAWDENADNPQGRGLKGVMVCWEYLKDSDYFKDALNGKYPLMQFTGLLDKKGVEIYENDILKTPCKQTFYIKKPNIHGLGAKMGNREIIGVVVCEWDCYGFVFKHIKKGMHNFNVPNSEVIGNIFEHPNLLK